MASVTVPETSKTVTLVNYIPEGLPGPEHFSIVEAPSPTPDTLEEGEVLAAIHVMSADPYLRSGCKSEEKGGAVPRPMAGFVVGSIVASKSSNWKDGDMFGGSLPFCTVQVVKAAAVAGLWNLGKLPRDKASLGVGVLGMPGSTAYGGLFGVLRPNKEKKEVLWVSGAGGAVGSLVGQLAKNISGCTVIGSCGGPDKCKMVKEKFGFDHVIDYKTVSTAEELAAKLKEVAPDGIDMYFDNVGGIHFEAAMATLAPYGRVAVCGGISRYNEGERGFEKFHPTDMIYTFQRVEGFMCRPWLSGKEGNFHTEMPKWLAEGKVVAEETVFEGIDQWPMAFQSLFTGGNNGKVVINV
eukprot:m.449387 g.449387  ORF g.449387 m.449387 type:complete len:352 (-) comp19811_c0_seq1:71-1126(-)